MCPSNPPVSNSDNIKHVLTTTTIATTTATTTNSSFGYYSTTIWLSEYKMSILKPHNCEVKMSSDSYSFVI